MNYLFTVFAVLFPLASAAQELTYFSPGDILPNNVDGVTSRTVAFPDWVFPMEVGNATGHHAYIGTQLSAYHGLEWSNDPRLFAYPHRDNQCEPRRWAVNACPSSKGHQGVDIRANDRTDNHWNVVAVEAGTVTRVTSNTTVVVRNGTRSVRYLHMHPNSIENAGIRRGVQVNKGQVLGKVSCYMNGSCQTSQHLHFDAHAGVAAAGNFYHVYPSLIAAYRRAWGLSDIIENGALKRDPDREVGGDGTSDSTHQPLVPPTELCAGVAVDPPLETVDAGQFASLWLHNCSVMGLRADTMSGTRSFTYYQPKSSIAELVSSDPMLFEGNTAGGQYSGRAKSYSNACGTTHYTVSGPVGDHSGVPVVTMTGTRERRDAQCNVIGTAADTLVFSYLGSVGPIPIPDQHEQPEENVRTTLTEKTRNFMAITFYPDENGNITVLPYVANYPGLSEEEGEFDSKGGLIPRMRSDEAGVGISWVWLQRRAQFVDNLVVTPRQVAHSIAGVDPSICDEEVRPTAAAVRNLGDDIANRLCNAVTAYLRGYVGFANGRNFAADYFGRTLGLDETLNLAQPEVAFAWMRTMYSHESGKPAVVSADVFTRGQRLGYDWISQHYGG